MANQGEGLSYGIPPVKSPTAVIAVVFLSCMSDERRNSTDQVGIGDLGKGSDQKVGS